MQFVWRSDTRGFAMRINIEIDDRLMANVLSETPFRTKRAAVEEGLRLLLDRSRRRRVAGSFGKYPWDGDLDELRGRPCNKDA